MTVDHGGTERDVGNVIITGELDRRPSRAPNYEAENCALTALADAMSIAPDTVLQQLTELAMNLTHSDSAGISLLQSGGKQDTFCWVATAGAWTPYRGSTMSRDASPCGEVIARNAILLMGNPQRSFPALLQAEPGISEGLLAPFYFGGVAVGTVWTIKHSPDDHFEAEDARILKSLARFAAAAHQTVQALQSAKISSQQAELRAQQLVMLAEISTEFFGTCDMDFLPIYGNAAAMRMVGLSDLEQVKRTPLQEFFFPEDLDFITKEFFPRVLREGQGKIETRFRHFVTGEPVWVDYSLVVLKDEMGRPTGLGTVTHDLTERKRAEAALRESEERQAFLLRLSDTLRPLRDPFEIQTATMRLVVEHLDVMRASYFQIDPDQDGFTLTARYERGALPIPSHMRMSDFALGMADDYRKGRTFVLTDAETEVATERERAAYRTVKVRAAVGVPLVKSGLLLGVFGVHSAAPRHWSDAEVQLLEDIADRIWAAVDRAHAETTLRESAERQAVLLKLSDALRPLAEPLAVQVEAMRVLGQHLAVDRAQYHEVEPNNEWIRPGGGYANGGALHVNRSRMDEFGAFVRDAYEGGRTLIVADTELDERLSTAERIAFAGIGVRAFVAVPLVKNGRFVAVLGLDNLAARSWSPTEIALAEEVAQRTWAAVERARVEASLHESDERFRQFSNASTDILWIRDAKSLQMVFASPAFETIYGIPGPDKGGINNFRTWAHLIESECRSEVLANFRRIRKGERLEQEFRMRRASDGALRWIHDTSFPLLDSAGHVRWVAGLGADITEARAFADRQEVLVAELQHRTRNLIAVVGSLAERTVESATSLEDFEKRFGVRLSALSRVQGLLSHLTIGDRVTFDELLNTELAAHGASNGLSKQLTLSGPMNVPLRSGTVQTFALALHELATNAVKYGAFSSPNGHLTVTWRVEPGVDNQPPDLHLEWRETGVSILQHDRATARRGYGRELIEHALPYQLGASTTYDLRADGVCCTIAVPISHGAATGSEEG